jgi:hypothetical protein
MDFSNPPVPPPADRAFEEVDRVLADTAIKLRAFQGKVRATVSRLTKEWQDERDRHVQTCEAYDQLYLDYHTLLSQLKSNAEAKPGTLALREDIRRPDTPFNANESQFDDWLDGTVCGDDSPVTLPAPAHSWPLVSSPTLVNEVVSLDHPHGEKRGKSNSTSD